MPGFWQRAAFDYAVSIWEGVIDSSVTIEIDAKYEDLGGGGVLGSARTLTTVLGSAVAGADEPGAYYSAALANAISGTDNSVGTSEIEARFNNNAGTKWYFGTDGNGAADEYDFVTVVLHEIGHGLGFYSNVTSTGAFAGGGPSIYDYYVRDNASGDVLANMALGARATAVTSDDLSWNGPFGVDAAGGNPALYAPAVWENGSSISHLNESTYPAGGENSLMTPQLANGEVIHSPGPITIGMLQDMGWKKPAGEAVSLKAGTTLSSDMQVGQDGINLSKDLVMTEGSKLAYNSILAVNTTNAGTAVLENRAVRTLSDLSVLTSEGAQAAIGIADSALMDLDDIRSQLGSIQNQFVSTVANLAATQINVTASESIIRDVDFVEESMNLARLKVTEQTAAFALGKANASTENVLSLLQ